MELDPTPLQDPRGSGPQLGTPDRTAARGAGDGASVDALLRSGSELPASFLATDAAGQRVGAETLLAQATAARAQMAAEQSVDPGKVDQAVAVITERLTSGFGNPVRHRDLVAVQGAVEGLTSNEATRAIGRLSDGQLTTWVNEMHQSGLRGGFSRAEIDSVYATLAERLDGRQLSRFAAALDDRNAPFDEGQRFGQIVGREASVEARAGLVRASQAQAGADSPSVGLAGGEALASLRGAALDATLRDLGPSGIASTVARAAANDVTTYSAGYSATSIATHDVETVARIAETLAQASDPRAKAAAFANAASMLESFQPGISGLGTVHTVVQGRSDLRDAVGDLVRSDAPGVTRWLTNEHDPHGLALKAYLTAELDAGRDRQVTATLMDLRGGGAVSAERWMETQTNGVYQNARNLGYAIGAVKGAILEQTGDRRDRIESLNTIFGTTLGAAGAAHPAAGVVATVLTGISSEAARGILQQAERDGRDLALKIEDLTFPRAENGDRYAGPARNEFQTTRNAVVLDQR